jgi:hypothetical protein
LSTWRWKLAGGVSAGLSLYEETPPPGVFRWQYLRGVLSPFNGATVNAGEKMHRRAGVKMHHGRRQSATTLNSAFQFDQ